MDIQDLLEQRRAPRFETELGAEIITPEKSIGHGVIRNISRSGLQIECSIGQMDQLMPNQGLPARVPKINLTVNFSVPTSTQAKAPIIITCEIIYVRRLARETHQLGCHFLEFHNQCNNDLEDFLQRFASSQPKAI